MYLYICRIANRHADLKSPVIGQSLIMGQTALHVFNITELEEFRNISSITFLFACIAFVDATHLSLVTLWKGQQVKVKK